MSQPVAAARTTRRTPRCVTATTGTGLPATRSSHGCSRARTSRGLSPPGGRKSSPRASFCSNAAPSASRSSSSVLPSQSPQSISISALSRATCAAGEELRRLDGARERARHPRGSARQLRRHAPCPDLRASALAQRNVAASLHPALFVPGRAGVADEGDDHHACAGARSDAASDAAKRAASRSAPASIENCPVARAKPASPRRRRNAGSPIRRDSASASAAGDRGGDEEPGRAVVDQLRNAGNARRHAGELLALRFEQHVGQAVAVAVVADAARQRRRCRRRGRRRAPRLALAGRAIRCARRCRARAPWPRARAAAARRRCA